MRALPNPPAWVHLLWMFAMPVVFAAAVLYKSTPLFVLTAVMVLLWMFYPRN